MKLFLVLLGLCFLTIPAFSSPKSVRWTLHEDGNPDFTHIIDTVNAKTGLSLSQTDFILIEDRELANTHYSFLVQAANKIPIKGQSLRIWTSKFTGQAVQVEAAVDAPPAVTSQMRWAPQSLSSSETMDLVREELKNQVDHAIRGVQWQDYWDHGDLVRFV